MSTPQDELWIDMTQFDPEVADALWDGREPPHEAPAWYGDVRELITAARRPASAEELADEARITARMLAAVRRSPSAAAAGSSRSRWGRVVAMKVSAAATVGVLGITAAAATIGTVATVVVAPAIERRLAPAGQDADGEADADGGGTQPGRPLGRSATPCLEPADRCRPAEAPDRHPPDGDPPLPDALLDAPPTEAGADDQAGTEGTALSELPAAPDAVLDPGGTGQQATDGTTGTTAPSTPDTLSAHDPAPASPQDEDPQPAASDAPEVDDAEPPGRGAPPTKKPPKPARPARPGGPGSLATPATPARPARPPAPPHAKAGGSTRTAPATRSGAPVAHDDDRPGRVLRDPPAHRSE